MNETTPRDTSASGSTRDKVRETAADLAGSAKEQASRLAGQAKDKAEQQFNTQRQSVVTEIESFASVMRDAGSRLRDQNASPIGATVVNTIADRLETFGRSMQGKNLDAVFGDVETFARRNPAAFLGTAAALGFLASRFIKSTRRTGPFDTWSANDLSASEFSSGAQFGRTSGYGAGSTGFSTGSTGFSTGSTGFATGTTADISGTGATTGSNSTGTTTPRRSGSGSGSGTGSEGL